jgi:hypothetical protein
VTTERTEESQPGKVSSGSPVGTPPCVVERPGAKRGGTTDRSVASAKLRGLTNVVIGDPPQGGSRGSRAAVGAAKAREGVWEPEAGTEEPSGVMGVERSDGCPRKWGGPPRPRHGGWAGSDAWL